MSRTWSPLRVGVGAEGSVGPIKMGAAAWVKFGSNGSMAVEGSAQAGIGHGVGLAFGVDATTEIRAAQNEEIGSSAYFSDLMGC